MNWLIAFYWKLCIIVIVVSLIVHYIVVLPFLTARGSAGIVSWLTNIRDGRDLEKYREYCIKEGKPLFVYNFLFSLSKIGIGLLIGWIVLILLSAGFDK